MKFRQGRPLPVSNESLARALEGRQGFSVQHEFTDADDEGTDPVVTMAKPVKKTRRTDADA